MSRPMSFREAAEIAWNERFDPIDGGACERCRRSVPRDGAQFHHRVFRSRGGKHTPDNLEILCLPCHTAVHNGT